MAAIVQFDTQDEVNDWMGKYNGMGTGNFANTGMSLMGPGGQSLGTIAAPNSTGLQLTTPDNTQYNLWGSGGSTTPISQQQQQQQPNYTDMFNQWGSMFNTTLQNLGNLWGQQNKTPTSGSSTGGDPGLSNLYPRANWGNYQNTGRGARYFDAGGTGNYQTL